MTQGGEFAFVLYAAARAVGLIDAEGRAILTAIIIVSMAMTPLFVLIGFGRFGQVVSQPLLARGYTITIIDHNPETIRAAAQFGFKAWYGDGRRLDILHAAGAHHASIVLVCVDDPAAATKIVEAVRHEFPGALLLSRAQDRDHGLELVKAGVDYPVRETFASALKLSRSALERLGEPEDAIDDVIAEVRRRDEERFALQLTGGMSAGRELMFGHGGEDRTLKTADKPVGG